MNIKFVSEKITETHPCHMLTFTMLFVVHPKIFFSKNVTNQFHDWPAIGWVQHFPCDISFVCRFTFSPSCFTLLSAIFPTIFPTIFTTIFPIIFTTIFTSIFTTTYFSIRLGNSEFCNFWHCCFVLLDCRVFFFCNYDNKIAANMFVYRMRFSKKLCKMTMMI